MTPRATNPSRARSLERRAVGGATPCRSGISLDGVHACLRHRWSIWDPHRDRTRLHRDPVGLGLRPRAAVDLVGNLAVELDLHLAGLRDPEERRALRPARHGARDRTGPLGEALGGDDRDVEPAVVGRGIGEHLDASEERADVAGEHAARRSVVPGHTVDLDRRVEGRSAHAPGARPDVGRPAEPVLEAAVGAADHVGVEARAGHDGEPLAVHARDVDRPLASLAAR